MKILGELDNNFLTLIKPYPIGSDGENIDTVLPPYESSIPLLNVKHVFMRKDNCLNCIV